ncbi:TPA: hypothetical protein EYP70_03920, partial [Candidatus Bathyarchaeota archaeon]|nr:hypothetical protein [Candidatus Bathyarchaeota archaeon]
MKLFQVKKPNKGFLTLIKQNKALSALIVTLLIIALLLSPFQAIAISVSIEDLTYKKIIKGEEYEFYIDMLFESEERVPVEIVKLTFIGPTSFTYMFPANGGDYPYLRLEPYKSIITGLEYPFGYWYGPGYLYGYGYGYFPWGYGYGYYPEGYGYGYYGYAGYTQILRWKATLFTSDLEVGDYKAIAEVKSNDVWWGGDPTGISFYIVDYGLAVSPDSISIRQGEVGSVTVNVTSHGRFSSPVNLSITGLPTGVTPTFSPSSVIPPEGGYETSILTLNVSTVAPTGSYSLKVIGSCLGVSGVTVTKEAWLTLTITPYVPPPPVGVPPIAVPTPEQIVENPVGIAPTIEGLVIVGMAAEAAAVLAEAAEIDLVAVATCLANIGSGYAAQIMELLPVDLAAKLFEAMVVNLLSPWKAADIMKYMDITAAAKIMKKLITLNLEAATAIAENLPLPYLARLLAEIARLPNTPERAALLVDAISLEKAIKAIEYMVKFELLEEAGLILAFVSEERLVAIWAGLPEVYREILLPYLTAETLIKLKMIFKVVTFNLVVIPTETTRTVSYPETGVDLTITAIKDTGGMVKTGLYVINPYEEAATPEGVTLKKFVYVDALFPKGTVDKITMAIHYTNAEVK